MTSGERAFLALAEELSFTRAAEKLYMSQQGLSDHIRRLEREYDTILVTRKPHVALTASGEALYGSLLEKLAMERDLRRMISDIDGGEIGEVTVGIASSRLRVFASDIIQRFYEAHPKVHVRIVSGLTVQLLQHLLQGELDFVIGVNPAPYPELVIEPIFEDSIYLAVPASLAEERTGKAGRVDLRSYADIPFIRDHEDSTTGAMIDGFLAQHNIHLDNILAVSDHNIQAALANRLGAAMFAAKSVAFFKEGEILRKGLRILEIEGLSHTVNVSLISSGNRVYPRCVLDLMEVSRHSLRRFHDRNIDRSIEQNIEQNKEQER